MSKPSSLNKTKMDNNNNNNNKINNSKHVLLKMSPFRRMLEWI